MTTRILINGKEVSNPFIRALLILGVVVTTGLITSMVLFVLLPIIGIVATLSVGFVVVFIIGTLISVVTLTVVFLLFAGLFGAAEFSIEKRLNKH